MRFIKKSKVENLNLMVYILKKLIFKEDDWGEISQGAKSLINKMLTYNYKDRITA